LATEFCGSKLTEATQEVKDRFFKQTFRKQIYFWKAYLRKVPLPLFWQKNFPFINNFHTYTCFRVDKQKTSKFDLKSSSAKETILDSKPNNFFFYLQLSYMYIHVFLSINNKFKFFINLNGIPAGSSKKIFNGSLQTYTSPLTTFLQTINSLQHT